jgi:hypothetical protein
MADLAIDDEHGGELDEAEVMAPLFLPPGQQATVAVEPAVSDLDHPAPRRMALRIARRRQGAFVARLGREVGRAAAGQGLMSAGVVVVLALGQWDHHAIKQIGQLFHIMPVGPGDQTSDGKAMAFGQEVPFRAGFAPVGRVASRGVRLARPPFLPNGALTMHPSAASQLQSKPISASYSRSRTAQARSRLPVATHSENRSWTVDLGPYSRGKTAHWLPVRANQISPSKMARSSRRGRPGFLRTLSLRRIGSSFAHRASSTRQIVGSSRCVAGRAEGGAFLPGSYHDSPLSG